MGGKGSGQPIGCGLGKGKCGTCDHLERRGPRGHHRYYCKLTGRRTDRQGCPLIEDIPPVKKVNAKKKMLKRVENPRPGVTIDWIEIEVPA